MNYDVIEEIRAERYRQINKEGWSFNHDDTHDQGELALAGASYIINAVAETRPEPNLDRQTDKWTLHAHASSVWPWHRDWWKPKDRRRDLIRAAALIVAEIERLDRAGEREAA